MKSPNLQKAIAYWKTGATQDFKAAQSLFDKKFYPHCLFFCHLTLEKLLKGLVIKHTGESAPHSHELAHLATLAKINLLSGQRELLEAVNYETRHF